MGSRAVVRSETPDYGPFMSGRFLGPLQAVLVCCAAAVPPLGTPEPCYAQGTIRLQLDGVTGDWQEYSHRTDLLIDFPDDLGGPATTRTTIRLRQVVDDVSPEAITFATTLVEVSLDVRPPPPELPDLSGIQGIEFRLISSRSGRTLSLQLAGQEAEAGSGLVEQVENWLEDLGFPRLPDRAVAIGDEWSEAKPVPAAALGLAVDFDVLQTRTVRLTEVRSVGGKRVAFLAVRTVWEPAPDRVGAGGGVVSLRGAADQTVRFDLELGRFLGGTGTSQLELVLTPEGGSQYVAVYAEGRQITGLTASGGPGVRE